MSAIHGKVHIQYCTGRMPHPFENVLVGHILLGTVTGKEMPEGMQLVLLRILKAALFA